MLAPVSDTPTPENPAPQGHSDAQRARAAAYTYIRVAAYLGAWSEDAPEDGRSAAWNSRDFECPNEGTHDWSLAMTTFASVRSVVRDACA
jgi:hypothetical protein